MRIILLQKCWLQGINVIFAWKHFLFELKRNTNRKKEPMLKYLSKGKQAECFYHKIKNMPVPGAA